MTRLTDLIDRPGREHSTALITKSGRHWSYSELSAIASKLESTLEDKGICGHRIGVIAKDDALHVLVLLAMGGGNAMIPINPSYREDKLPAFLKDQGITFVVTDYPESLGNLSIPHLNWDGVQKFEFSGQPVDQSLLGQTSPNDEILIIPTSGSTGRPKLVGYDLEHLEAAARANIQHFGLCPDDVYLCPMPLFHAHGLISITVFVMIAGAQVILSPADPAEIAARSSEYQVTCFSAAPTIHQGLLRYSRTSPIEFNSLRFARSSSAPLPYAIFDELERLFGCPLVETYGLTESTSVVVSNDLDQRRKGSVGRPIGDTKAAVKTENGISETGRGELLLSGPSIVLGYLDQADTSPKDSWFQTGDLAEIEQDGHIQIVGRLKEMVKRGGYGVSPTEIDNAICAIEGVNAACTFSLPHPTLGEELVSVVRADAALHEMAILDELIARLPTYKVPAAIRVVDAIPRNQIGKIVRNEVREQFGPLFSAPFVAPTTREEARILSFWEKHLGAGNISILDNLILKGVDPLIVSTIDDGVFEEKLTVQFMLRYPTIRAQAEFINAEQTL